MRQDQILELILEEFTEQLPGTADAIPRDFELPEAPEMIQVAIGMRRTGKTYFLFQKIRELIAEGTSIEQILYINFEDDRVLPMNQKELGQFLDAFYTLYPQNHDRLCHLFLDEIQNVEGWPLVIRRFHDKKNVRIYLTGSSAKLLSKEIATSLRGRSIATEIYPYSFHEYWKTHQIKVPKPPIGKKSLDLFQKHLKNYFQVGGFPAIQSLHENEQRTILQNYVHSVIFRDVIERHKITNTSLIKYLIKSLLNSISSPFSVNKFYNDIKSQGYKVGKDTLYQYIEHLEDAFLIYTVPLFTESPRKRQTNPKKIYAVDNGLVHANCLNITPNIGSFFENLIYLDLRRAGKRVYYYHTQEGYEIDFLAQSQDGTMEIIQVTWDQTDKKTLEREERALHKAEKELGIKGCIIDAQSYLKDQFV